MPQYEVFLTCPDHQREVSIVLPAKNEEDARAKLVGRTIVCPWSTSAKPSGKRWGVFPAKQPPQRSHTFTATSQEIVAVRPYPWTPLKKEAFSGAKKPKAPAQKVSPTYLIGYKRFPDDTVTVSLRFKDEERTVLFARDEVLTFDALTRTGKAAGHGDVKDELTAFLIANGATTKSLATGFLNAQGFHTDVSTIGEALSRLRKDDVVYSQARRFRYGTTAKLPTQHRIGPGGVYTKRSPLFMGEYVYGLPETTRLKILEEQKLDPYVQWWRPELLTFTPLTTKTAIQHAKLPIQYEWVRIMKPTGVIRSAQDFKRYGPYPKDTTAKLPISLGYLLVKTGNATWVNANAESVAQAEQIFKYQSTEKVTRQAVLG